MCELERDGGEQDSELVLRCTAPRRICRVVSFSQGRWGFLESHVRENESAQNGARRH